MASRVTELLLAWGDGDESALNELVPLVHAELRRMASAYMAGERTGHTLQPTALVNELYLRLVDVDRIRWSNRAHFFAVAARLMRRVLVDFARARGSVKRGRGTERVAFDEALVIDVGRGHDLIALDDALIELARLSPRQSQVIELRFFGGLNVEESASVLGVSGATVMRDWTIARSWLMRALDRTSREATS